MPTLQSSYFHIIIVGYEILTDKGIGELTGLTKDVRGLLLFLFSAQEMLVPFGQMFREIAFLF